MKKFLLYIIFITLPISIWADDDVYEKSVYKADSIMNKVFKSTAFYSKHIMSFEGQAYLKGVTKVEKSNFMLKYFPSVFPFERNTDGTIFETINNISYDQSNKLVISPLVLNCSSNNALKKQINIAPILGLNIYNAEFYETFILPGASMAKDIYEYKIDSMIWEGDKSYYKIKFIPKRKSLKLLDGCIYIEKESAKVVRFEASGWLDIAKFKIVTDFNDLELLEMLPSKCSINVTYSIFNNVAEYDFECDFQYNTVFMGGEPRKNNSLDRTQYFRVNTDSITIIRDSVFWNRQRQKLLTEDEVKMYQISFHKDSMKNANIRENDKSIDYVKISKRLVSFSDISSKEKLQYSGLFNPALIGYTHIDGLIVRQQVKYRKELCKNRYLGLLPEVGYAFKTKQLLYSFESTLLYKPSKIGQLTVSFRNGNKGFSSAFVNQVNNVLDTINNRVDFSHLDIDYYKDYRCNISNNFEVCNGLNFTVGLDYNYRKPVKTKDYLDGIQVEKIIKKYYADFSPFMRLSYTPKQQYIMEGNKKIYINSKYPTLTAEYAHGFPGVLSSTGEFSRLEFDIHQNINLRGLRNFSYRMGAGGFFNQKTEYFVAYKFFQRSNYPNSWQDHIGGVFNLLDDYWYCSATNYVQGHLMYESPFLLLNMFKRISKFVLTERVYASQLYTNNKISYTEVGYGMGNHIFNIGYFVGFHGLSLLRTGFKVSFEFGKFW